MEQQPRNVGKERAGSVVVALATIEQGVQSNPEQLVSKAESLRTRGELRLKQGQLELADADFRDAIALGQKMGAKIFECVQR